MRILISGAWPWYVSGPLIGLFVPALLFVGNTAFGVSSSLRHTCAALLPGGTKYFAYDWKKKGLWNLIFVFGIMFGGFLATHWSVPHDVAISPATRADLASLGIRDFSGLAPREIFQWPAILSLKGFVSLIVGGFLVGFGTAYAGGCTSGHAISGLADFQLPSLIAVIGFFAGGLLATHFLLPLFH